MADFTRMVRPWFQGQVGDHIYRDCRSLAEEGEPREGVGWLDPHGTDVCDECLRRYDIQHHEAVTLDEY